VGPPPRVPLPPCRIGHSEDSGFQNRRVLVEDFFDFGTVDVLTTGDDHILGAIDEENVALGIHTTEVSAVIPPMTESIGGLLGFVPVALHDIGATYNNLANPPRWQVVATGSDDPDINKLNKALAGERAEAVRKYLVDTLKIPAHRLKAVANEPGGGKDVIFVFLQAQ